MIARRVLVLRVPNHIRRALDYEAARSRAQDWPGVLDDILRRALRIEVAARPVPSEDQPTTEGGQE